MEINEDEFQKPTGHFYSQVNCRLQEQNIPVVPSFLPTEPLAIWTEIVWYLLTYVKQTGVSAN